MKQHTRLIFSLGSIAMMLAIGGVIFLSGLPGRSSSMYMTDGPVYNDVAALVRDSSAVAEVRVVQVGKSYRVPFDPPVVAAPPTRTDGGKAGLSAGSVGAASNASGGQQLQPNLPTHQVPRPEPNQNGILMTDVTVEVVEPVRGATLRKGDRLVISQLGGTDERGKAIVTEHDPALQVGDVEIMFLRPGADRAKFSTTGGGQGRFIVTANNTLRPVHGETNLARATTGKPASFLKAEVQSVR